MVIEIITDSSENPFRYIIKSNGRKVELRACNGNKDINQIIYKERSDKYKGHLFKPLELIDKIEQRHNQHHRIIEEISHIKCFTDQKMRECMTEPDGRLPVENKLFGGSKDMIQIGKETVELKSIRIPIGKQTHLNDNTYKRRELTRSEAVKIHQQESHCSNHSPIQQHVPWMIHPLKQEQNQYGSQQIINQCNLLHSKQPFPGFHTLK